MKRCTSCQLSKPTEEFYRHRSHSDGLTSQCKPCHREARRTPRGKAAQRRANQSEAGKARRARYRARHPERVRDAERKYQRERRADYQARLDRIKMDQGCIDCGYDAHPRALDFDHRGDAPKLFNVSKILRLTASWERIAAEVAKCDVRCANCHRIRTAEGNHYTNRHATKVHHG